MSFPLKKNNQFETQNMQFDSGNEVEMINDTYKVCCGQ